MFSEEQDEGSEDEWASGTAELAAQRSALADAVENSATLGKDGAVTGSSVATLNMQKKYVSIGKFREGPRIRPPELVQRDQDRRKTHEDAGTRSSWPPQNAPEDRGSWNDRHQVVFANANLHPNYRSYFDRFRNRRDFEPSDELTGTLKPSWRLTTEAPLQDEREAKKELIHSTGSCAKPYLSDVKLEVLHHPAVFSGSPSIHDRSFSTPELAQKATTPEPKDDEEEGQDEDEDMKALPKSASQSQTDWSQRHQITWCNERHTTGKPLNPVLLRSYFDRTRTPGHTRCDSPEPKGQRVLPEWRLRTDPLTGTDMGRSTMSSGSNISTAVDILRAPTRAQTSKGNDLREKRWNARHDVVFKNTEVSRLDRCYFDRWKEPEANLYPEKQVRSLKPTWSLTKEGSPEKTAEMLLAKSAGRHSAYGTWSGRHGRLFSNDIHMNLKSYFDRPREAENMSGIRQRKKLSKKDKLKMNWSLQEYPSKFEYTTTLRAQSTPHLAITDQPKMRKTAPAWFSSHGVVF